MKITVNKAKIKKLMNFAEKSDSIGTKALFFCAGNVWAAKGGTLISTSYKIEEGEELKIPFSVKIEKIKKIVDKAPEVNKGEIQIDFYEIESESLCNRAIGYLERMANAETVAEIDRMFYALVAPKSRSESVNIMVTDKQVKAELIDHYKFVGGVEIEQKNNLAAPLLFYLSDDFIFPLSKKQSEKYEIVRESDYQYKEDDGYYLKYESLNGTTYQALHYKGEKAKFYSDEIKNAFKLAIGEMNKKAESTTEPEPTTIDPIKTTESEESKMQEKKEIETTEPTTAAEIQNEEIQTSEPTSEPTPEPTAATATESVQNREPEKENRPPIVSKTAPDVSEIIELFRNFDDYSAHHALEELFQKEQAKKGFLYFSEIIEICKAVNAGAWNTFFYCRPMHFGATLSESPEPGARVIVSDSVYSFENRLGYSEEERAEKCKICGNAKAQFKVSFCCEILEPLRPTEKLERFKNHWNKEYIGRPYVLTPSDAIHPEVKAMIKTLNDYKRVAGHLYGKSGNYNSPIAQCFHYYRDGEEITGKEPGGASRIDDYTIERVPNHNAIIVNFTLTSKKPQPKPEPEKKQEDLKPTPAPIEIKREPEPVKAAVASIPAPIVACKVAAPVSIPEPEPKPTDEEPDLEQIDKAKPTGAELRYSLSLLAMPYPIDTLIEKFLKKTNKPVRYSIVEKLLMTIDRGSVPKPGESKREYIKAYYQTH